MIALTILFLLQG